jgi:hypothetical protein
LELNIPDDLREKFQQNDRKEEEEEEENKDQERI